MMALRIEDYAMIGDCHTAALVGNDGSIDWLCLPRFDSAIDVRRASGQTTAAGCSRPPGRRGHQPELPGTTFVLLTRWVTADGEVEVTDLMPVGDRRADRCAGCAAFAARSP